MSLSQHASIRMQQRGIPSPVVDWLLAFGAIDHQRGAELYYFDKRARQALQQHVSERLLRRYAKALDAYVVCEGSQVITVGHRYRRVVRH